jgi:RNA polymerase sigma-70 factor (ECF subfamily)
MATGTLRQPAFSATAGAGPDAGALSLARVYADHFRYVFRCVRALGVREEMIDDAVHDVFLVVQQKLPEFDGRYALTTWLYAIALRIARRYRTDAAKHARRFATEASEGTSCNHDETHDLVSSAVGLRDAEGELETEERLAIARRALEALDDDKREAFVLAHIEQMSAPEIVEITGLPLNTVYSRIRAARLAFGAEVARLQLIHRGKGR